MTSKRIYPPEKHKKARAKRDAQLGMSQSGARMKLFRALIWHFVEKSGTMCHRCGNPMTADDYTVEHVVPWIDSADPPALFFDVHNIAFSHFGCNAAAARKPSRTGLSRSEMEKRLYSAEKRRLKCLRETARRRAANAGRPGFIPRTGAVSGAP